MDNQRITTLIDQLDALVTTDSAQVKLMKRSGYDEDQDEITGTQSGLLRFGIEIMRVAINNGPVSAIEPMSYLIHQDSNFNPWTVTMVDAIQPEPPLPRKTKLKQSLQGIAAFTLLVVAVSLCMLLLQYLWKLLTGLF